MNQHILDLAQRLIDGVIAVLPQPRPGAAEAAATKIVAHRGNCDPKSVENSLDAFAQCDELGVWGIELDIQWSKDDVAVVSHDPDLARVYRLADHNIAEHDFADLKSRIPELPRLEEIITRYGGKRHLMIELKRETLKPRHFKLPEAMLEDLEPVRDYHLLSLEFDFIEDIPAHLARAMLMVAEINTKSIAAGIVQRHWPACAGHYLLFTRKIRRQLRQQNKQFGVGFVTSKNGLYREINRGADWIFTNDAARLQSCLEQLKRTGN